MSTQYRLVQSGKTASGGCSAGQGSSEPVAPRIFYLLFTPICWYILQIISSLQVLQPEFCMNFSFQKIKITEYLYNSKKDMLEVFWKKLSVLMTSMEV
jgi:hypothetical protein